MLDILIVDDHAIFRRGLKHLLEREPDMRVPGEASQAGEALSLARASRFDLVILDISLPGRSGLDVLPDFKRQNPRLPVLILSMYPEEQFALRALKSGAAGYITKDAVPEELAKAIRTISAGGRYVSSALAQHLASVLSASDGLPHERLSDREFEILCLITAGRTPTEIARDLQLSVKTVSTYRTRILTKLGLRTTSELIRYGVEHGLPQPASQSVL